MTAEAEHGHSARNSLTRKPQASHETPVDSLDPHPSRPDFLNSLSHEQTSQCRRRSGFGALQFFWQQRRRRYARSQPRTRALVREAAWSSSRDPCRRLCTRAREPKMAAVPCDSTVDSECRCPRGTFLLPAAFSSYASGPVRLAPRGWLRSGMARDCRGCRHGPVRAVRPRLDPGGGHRGAVEETGGLTTARCSCGAALSGARVLCWIDTKLAQLSVARIHLPLAELLEELMRARDPAARVARLSLSARHSKAQREIPRVVQTKWRLTAGHVCE